MNKIITYANNRKRNFNGYLKVHCQTYVIDLTDMLNVFMSYCCLTKALKSKHSNYLLIESYILEYTKQITNRYICPLSVLLSYYFEKMIITVTLFTPHLC